MTRDQLIAGVKDEYARLLASEDQQHFHQTTQGVTPQKYYENLLDMVTGEIERGTFDNFQNGNSIVEAVANDKHKWLSGWEK